MLARTKTRRWLISAIAGGIVLGFLACCSGIGYIAYRSVNTIVETYEPARLQTVDGVTVDVDVQPHKRIKDRYGERLVGPPYQVDFVIRDSNGRMTRALLHSVKVAPSGGDAFLASVTKGDSSVSEFGVVSLIAIVERESLGAHAQIVADIELVMPTGSARQELTFLLRRGSRASLNIP